RELGEWGPVDGMLRIGAGVTYTRLIDELGDRLPGLAMASRTVGSPQIRNRGTVGGNQGTASPAGDALPPLPASDAWVELASKAGTRHVSVREFFTGPKRNAMRKDELIAAFLVEPAAGPQQFSKVGTRNAMVIAVCSFDLALDGGRRRVGTGIGSAGPTPLRAAGAEEVIQAELDWDGRRRLSAAARERFGGAVAAGAGPLDDIRGPAASRAKGIRRGGRSAVRFLHARPHRGDARPAAAGASAERRSDPRGAGRQHLPLHRVREDHRRGSACGGAHAMSETPHPTLPGERGGKKPRLAPPARTTGRVGESVPRPDGALKVRGDFPYSSDLQVEGMIWGATLRSPHPYARIISIDTTEAHSMPGVHAVLTHHDVPGRNVYGL